MLTIDHLEKCFGSTVLFRDLTFYRLVVGIDNLSG